MIKAEELMEKARDIGQRMGVTEHPQYARCVGFLDVRLVAFLLEMPKIWEEVEFDSMDAISEELPLYNR